MPLSDRIGQTFGRWLVVDVAPYADHNARLACLCGCGRRRVIPLSNLLNKRSTQCQSCSSSVNARRKQRAAMAVRPGRVIVDGRVRDTCPGCGKPFAGGRSRRCKACDTKHRYGRPYKHPVSMTIIAAQAGISRQAVHAHIKVNGWEASMKFYAPRSPAAAAYLEAKA